MAESKGSLLAKSVQKHAGRAKEKVSGIIYIKLASFVRKKYKKKSVRSFTFGLRLVQNMIPTEAINYKVFFCCSRSSLV